MEVTVEAGGLAQRAGEPSPAQQFRRVQRGELSTGDRLLNPGTNEVHKVLDVDDAGAVITTNLGPIAVPWADLIAVVWRIHE